MPDGFEVRGVIEGFYGAPWSHDARVRAIAHLASHGMNAYVHAPKEDPYHRRRWREPYPSERLDELLALHGHCDDHGVRFGFGISPGLDFDPESDDDRSALWAKLEPFARAGVDWFVLGFDDIPLTEGAGRAHGELAGRLHDRLPDARIGVVPVDYVGTRPSDYLDQLVAVLPESTHLFWTGTTVVPASVSLDDARRRAEATAGLPVMLWDNYPVNDAFMETALHLGPLRGRDPRLPEAVTGVLANPMTQPLASLIPLTTTAEYLADPAGYDPERAWDRAIDSVAQDLDTDAGALGALARACSASALSGPDDDPVHELVAACEAREPKARDALTEIFDAAAGVTVGLPDALVEEVGPWVEQATLEAAAGRAALGVLDGGDEGWAGVLAVMGMLLAWTAARRGSDRIVFGPRFACYPAIVQDDTGAVRVDPDAAVVEDANAVDRLCRLALERSGGMP